MLKKIRLDIPKMIEEPKEIATKVLRFLNGLKIIDELEFSNWYEQGWSKKEALSKKVILEEEYLISVINDNWDKKFPELGTLFSFWTGKDDNEVNSVVSFTLGTTSKNPNLKGKVLLKFPNETFNEEKVKKIISLLQEIWGKHSYDIF